MNEESEFQHAKFAFDVPRGTSNQACGFCIFTLVDRPEDGSSANSRSALSQKQGEEE
jgi:hypothetical protein